MKKLMLVLFISVFAFALNAQTAASTSGESKKGDVKTEQIQSKDLSSKKNCVKEKSCSAVCKGHEGKECTCTCKGHDGKPCTGECKLEGKTCIKKDGTACCPKGKKK